MSEVIEGNPDQALQPTSPLAAIDRITASVTSGNINPNQLITDADYLFSKAGEKGRAQVQPFLLEAVRRAPEGVMQVALIDRLTAFYQQDQQTHDQGDTIRRYIQLGEDLGVEGKEEGKSFLDALREKYVPILSLEVPEPEKQEKTPEQLAGEEYQESKDVFPEEYGLPPNPVRNAVLAEIPDVEARSIMGIFVPRAELRPYTRSSELMSDQRFQEWKKWNPQGKFLDLIRRQAGMQRAGQFYKDIFALAASSQDPIELQNAFGALAGVSTIAFVDLDQKDKSLIKGAQEAFLHTTITPQDIGFQAGELARNIFNQWNKTGDFLRRDRNTISRIFRQTFNKDAYSSVPGEKAPFFAETFFYLVLNKDFPIEFRQTVLDYIPPVFKFGALDREADIHNVKPFFNKEASFFTSVDVSWVYPHMAHFKRGATPDRSALDVRSLGEEYDKLRARALNLESNLKQTETNLAQAIKDKEELQRVVDQLMNLAQGRRGMSEEEREAAGYYKEFGGHPLHVLGIGPVYWKGWDADQRHTELMRAYRAKAKQYHYDVSKQDPSYDEIKEQLMTLAFTKVTNAFNYLDKNRARAEFPDLRI